MTTATKLPGNWEQENGYALRCYRSGGGLMAFIEATSDGSNIRFTAKSMGNLGGVIQACMRVGTERAPADDEAKLSAAITRLEHELCIAGTIVIPCEESIEQVKKDFNQNRQPGQRLPVTDPVITPFVRALILEGYSIKNDGKCDQLERCPTCENAYVYTATKHGAEIKLCPHCRVKQWERRKVA